MRLGLRADGDGPFAVRLAWLTAARLAVLTLVLVTTVWVHLRDLTSTSPQFRVALAVVGAAYVLAAAYALLLRFGVALGAVAVTQLVTDQLVCTAVVYLSGGAASGAASLYALTVVTGAVAIGRRGVWVAAISGAALYATLTAALAIGWAVPPSGGGSHGPYAVRLADVGYPLVVNLVGVAVVALLANSLAERLRLTGGELQAATSFALEAQDRAHKAEGRVAQAEDRAERAEDRAERAERLAALGRLAAGLAHEIRNPLSSISGSIELLRTGGSLEPEDQKLCEIIERETSRLNDIVSDMLELSRRRTPVLDVFDLAAVVREVATLAGRSGRGADVGVRCVAPERAMVDADPALMRQVIWNLLRNAVQASSAGDEVVVSLTREPDGGHATLAFVDKGPGIAPEARERLFDAFFTTRSQGVGIGLAVVKQILDDHEFELEVRSVEGQGATFSVRVPLAAEASGPGAGASPSSGMGAGGAIGASLSAASGASDSALASITSTGSTAPDAGA